MTTTLKKLNIGRYKVGVELIQKGNRIIVKSPFNRRLIAEIKSMEGAKWHGFDEPTPRKHWSIKDCARNDFRLAFLSGENPYEPYDRPLIEVESTRPLYEHQDLMVAHGLTRHYVIWAGEMGVGKSLSFIELLDHIPGLLEDQIWYVGPKSGVVSVKREFIKWKSKFRPLMMTYEKFTKTIRNWSGDLPAPRVICFDECSKLKNHTAQRSQSAKHVSEAIRKEWGDEGYIILMSGTPAPKAPTDWWHQCEVACPGYLKEGHPAKFKRRLCLVEMRQSITGGQYPHIVSWLDDENKCKRCGQIRSAPQHLTTSDLWDHEWEKSVNEVAALHIRIKDLALIQFKKDCLDLPEKMYEKRVVRPTVDTLRAARLIRKTSPRAITALTLLRELSDGFQYTEEVIGQKACPQCCGTGKYMSKVPCEEVDVLNPQDVQVEDFLDQEVDCDVCDENCEVDIKRRTTIEISTPKDDTFIQLLDDHEDGGRFVVWGGFTGTIDRLVRIAHQQGWTTLRVDGRGLIGTTPTGDTVNKDDLLDAMDASNPRRQELLDKYPKVCVTGHPKAGGMAYTFNASSVALFYSNDFDGEARMQAEDRIHRIGMDKNRGALIVDLVHLPTDELVLKNLRLKKKLQNLTMGELDDAFVNG